MKKKGFTLIELLVVIAVIAMLLAILVPTLKKAKGKARDLVDRNNLRSLGQAANLYLNSSKDRLFEYPTTGTNYLWLVKIGDMIDNINEIRHCPKIMNKIDEVKQDYAASPGSKWGTSLKPWLWDASSDPTNKYELGSYGMNGWLYAKATTMPWVAAGDENKPYSKRTEIKIPYKTPMFLDANWVDGWPKTDNVLGATGYNYETGDQTGGNSSGTRQIGRFVLGRHGTKTNVIFADSHADTITHADLWGLSWHRGSVPNFSPVIPTPLPKDN
jgi:prepilin-type N-terminal cleavage/methylation domain-containing protein/prepilin-type processing-associated H-X9-DG protein